MGGWVGAEERAHRGRRLQNLAAALNGPTTTAMMMTTATATIIICIQNYGIRPSDDPTRMHSSSRDIITMSDDTLADNDQTKRAISFPSSFIVIAVVIIIIISHHDYRV